MHEYKKNTCFLLLLLLLLLLSLCRLAALSHSCGQGKSFVGLFRICSFYLFQVLVFLGELSDILGSSHLFLGKLLFRRQGGEKHRWDEILFFYAMRTSWRCKAHSIEWISEPHPCERFSSSWELIWSANRRYPVPNNWVSQDERFPHTKHVALPLQQNACACHVGCTFKLSLSFFFFPLRITIIPV